MSPRIGITEIYLGGFQVFDEITRIPLSRLNFLFGPNSAGKSSIEDALLILSDLFTKNFFDYSGTEGARRLYRHWRRSTGLTDSLSNEMVLGFKGTVAHDIQSVLARKLGTPWKARSINGQGQSDIEFRATFGRADNGLGVGSVTQNFDLYVDGDLILSFKDSAPVVLNFGSNVLNEPLAKPRQWV